MLAGKPPFQGENLLAISTRLCLHGGHPEASQPLTTALTIEGGRFRRTRAT